MRARQRSRVCSGDPPTKHPSHCSADCRWVLAFRDIMLVESLVWLVALFLTGIVLVNQFVSIRECVKVPIISIDKQVLFPFPPFAVYYIGCGTLLHFSPITHFASASYP